MAIATLYECYNNPAVFTSEVKIRKSLAVKLILNTRRYSDVLAVFEEYTRKFKAESINTPQMKEVLSTIEKKLRAK
jgi:farnesyl-diphosphate farnesyltransferase